MKPIIVVNFKAYKTAMGENAVKLARVCGEVARKTKAKIMVAVQAADVYMVSKNVRIDVLGQHVDYAYPGAFTGSVLPESLKENNAAGSLLNHAEHRIEMLAIENAVYRCKKLGLYNVVCTPKIHQAKKIARLRPRYIAYEVPELIGTGKAISKMQPGSVAAFAKAMKKRDIIPLCGAGISNGEDVRIAMQLGCKGVLVASAVTNANKPREVLLDLVG